MVDFEMLLRTFKYRKFFKEHQIRYYWPTPLKILKLLLKPPHPEFQMKTKEPVTCYWKTSGCWGMYGFDGKSIFVYPWNNPGGVEETIKHEIIHLIHEPDVQGMSHEEKEKYIDSKEKEY